LRVGDEVYLFTEKGDEFKAVVTEVRKKESLLMITHKMMDKDNESFLKLTLLQGIVRGSKMDVIVQKATELGVEQLVPIITTRSVHPRNPEERQKRWQRISLQAAKQCGRRKGAHIDPPTLLKKINLSRMPNLKLLLYEVKGRGIKGVLSQFNEKKIALMVGPEGGWQEEEVRWALEKGFIPISLGPRILRTETASLAVLAILQYQLGDIGQESL